MKRRNAFFLFLFMFATPFLAFSQESKQRVARVDYNKAFMVAFDDFENRLRESKNQNWEYSSYVSDISNYNFGISQSKKYFVIVVSLRKTDVKINGGGAIYYVEKENMTVFQVQMLK